MKIIVDKNTHISKGILGTDAELWNFCGYIFLLLEEYYSEYLERNSTYLTQYLCFYVSYLHNYVKREDETD